MCQEYLEIKEFKKKEIVFNLGEHSSDKNFIKLKKPEEGKKEKKSKIVAALNKYEKTRAKGFYIVKSGLAEL